MQADSRSYETSKEKICTQFRGLESHSLPRSGHPIQEAQDFYSMKQDTAFLLQTRTRVVFNAMSSQCYRFE